jgi:hypothetical protein
MSLRVPLICAAALGLLAASPAAAAPSPVARAAKACDIAGKERKLGTTYVTTLSATGTSCATARKVVKAFHACRHRHGKGGRCTRRVARFRCTESRFNEIPIQYDSRVTCRRGKARVRHTYTQNT